MADEEGGALLAKDRLLLAAADLLDAGEGAFSTRAVCERAGVTAPTLYHHFGSKKGLIDAVLSHGFGQYVSPPMSTPPSDPIAEIRQGWDHHVAYGLQHPAFYARLYGAVRPGQPCAITSPAMARLRELFEEAAHQGTLMVTPAAAAAQVHAANVGVTLSLIAQPHHERDLALSDHVREAALAAILTGTPAPHTTDPRRTAAVALAAALRQDDSGLTAGETVLMQELLDRLSTTDQAHG